MSQTGRLGLLMEPSTPRRAMGARVVCATPRRGRAPINYSLGERIGKGAFATVYKAIHLRTGEFVAIKEIPLTKIGAVDSIMSEIELLQDLEHPNIVKYLGFMKDLDKLSIVLEYCENGSLAAICSKFGAFPENLLAMYMRQALLGLEYLHAQGTIHRDIKGGNILTTKDGVAKLADFGVATRTVANAPTGASLVGTPHWMAPEIIQMEEPSSACDIWSLGCTVVELRTGKPPNGDMPDFAAMYAVVQNDEMPIPADASSGLRDFLLLCFQKDPALRTSAASLLTHRWIRKHSEPGGHVADAAKTVQKWNDPARRRRMQVPSRLDLRAVYADVSGTALGKYVETEGFEDGFEDGWGESPEAEPHVVDSSERASKRRALDVEGSFAEAGSPHAGAGVAGAAVGAGVGGGVGGGVDAAGTVRRRPLAAYQDSDGEMDFDVDSDLSFHHAASDPSRAGDSSAAGDPFDGLESLPDLRHDREAAAADEAEQLCRVAALGTGDVAVKYARLAELLRAEPAVKRVVMQTRTLQTSLAQLRADPALAVDVLALIHLLLAHDSAAVEMFSLAGGVGTILPLAEAHPARVTDILGDICLYYQFGPRLLASSDDSVAALCRLVRVAAPGALRCVVLIFEQFGTRMRAELWRQFGRFHLLQQLAEALETATPETAPSLYDLLVSFSKTPPQVRALYADKHVLRLLMRAYRRLAADSPYRLTLLQIFKELSTVPQVLEAMQMGDLGPHLVHLLRKAYSSKGRAGHQAAIQLLPTVYNYCRIDAARQQDAAKSGVVPLLLQTQAKEPTLRDFSLPILCAMAHNRACRPKLWEAHALAALVSLVTEKGWEATAMAAIAAWLSAEPTKVAAALVAPASGTSGGGSGPTQFVVAVRSTRSDAFTGVVSALATMVNVAALRGKLPCHDLFVAFADHLSAGAVPDGLAFVKSLQIVKRLVDKLPAARGDLETSGLHAVLASLSQHELPVICDKLVRQILQPL